MLIIIIKLQNNFINNSVTIDLKERKACKTALCGKIRERSERRVKSELLIRAHTLNFQL